MTIEGRERKLASRNASNDRRADLKLVNDTHFSSSSLFITNQNLDIALISERVPSLKSVPRMLGQPV